MRMTRTIGGHIRLTIITEEDQQLAAIEALRHLIPSVRKFILALDGDGHQMGADGQGSSREQGRRTVYRVDLIGLSRDVTNRQWLEAMSWLTGAVERALADGGCIEALRSSLKRGES